VWLGTQKLAAIGVHVSRRVTIHGMAINVRDEATQPFAQRWFVPCGNPQGRAISLQEALASQAQGAAQPAETLTGCVDSPSVESAAERLLPLLLRRAGLEPCAAQRSSVALLSQSLFVE
jgi:hypothetical protein